MSRIGAFVFFFVFLLLPGLVSLLLCAIFLFFSHTCALSLYFVTGRKNYSKVNNNTN